VTAHVHRVARTPRSPALTATPATPWALPAPWCRAVVRSVYLFDVIALNNIPLVFLVFDPLPRLQCQ